MRELDVILNELAQGLRPMVWGEAWFAAMPGDEQTETLDRLALWCRQAHHSAEEGAEAIRRSGLKPTHTPAVLLARGTSQHHIATVARLRPPDERAKAFRLLVALLGVADERRRGTCRAHFGGEPCGHAWHELGPS